MTKRHASISYYCFLSLLQAIPSELLSQQIPRAVCFKFWTVLFPSLRISKISPVFTICSVYVPWYCYMLLQNIMHHYIPDVHTPLTTVVTETRQQSLPAH